MLPVLAFSFANAVRQYADRKEAAQRELVRGPELVIHEVGAVFPSADQVMLEAPSQPMLVRGETPACPDFLAGALAGRDVLSNMSTIDADRHYVYIPMRSPPQHPH